MPPRPDVFTYEKAIALRTTVQVHIHPRTFYPARANRRRRAYVFSCLGCSTGQLRTRRLTYACTQVPTAEERMFRRAVASVGKSGLILSRCFWGNVSQSSRLSQLSFNEGTAQSEKPESIADLTSLSLSDTQNGRSAYD